MEGIGIVLKRIDPKRLISPLPPYRIPIDFILWFNTFNVIVNKYYSVYLSIKKRDYKHFVWLTMCKKSNTFRAMDK